MAVLAILLVLLRVPVIFVALVPLTPPVIDTPVGTVQEYKVPDGTIPFVISAGVVVNNTPLHTVFVIELTIALGLSVTVIVNAYPFPQAVVLGVTVYAAVTEEEVVLLSVPVLFV